METLRQLFHQHFGAAPTRVERLQGELGGSGRQIVRLANEHASAIGIVHEVREENAAFIAFSRHFRQHALPVPEIYIADLERGAYLEQDLGDTTLFEFLSAHRDGAEIAPEAVAAYLNAVEVLPRFQVEAARDLDYSACYPRDSFDRQSISWDLNYFKYYFLKLSGVPFNEQALEDDFSRLTDFLLEAPRDYFLYRDFQSRNIMLVAGQPWFLDYQGGRRGALQYDVASLLYDAKADLTPQFREQLLNHYLEVLPRYTNIAAADFLRYFYAFVYVRIMQAMGAYGFRGFYERKPHFLKSVPYALKNLRWLLHNAYMPIELPALMSAFTTMLRPEYTRAFGEAPETGEVELTAAGVLNVQIGSFSFHRGWPKDESGHGGGFVFDARSLPNPGRLEEFKQLTGRDRPVAEYLERESRVKDYLAHAQALVEGSIAEYQRRGFDSLMVSFGCTGGQHRSVYLAEQLAARLRGRRGLNVVLRHRELEERAQ